MISQQIAELQATADKFEKLAHATQGKYGTTIVPELSMMDAIKRWE